MRDKIIKLKKAVLVALGEKVLLGGKNERIKN
jgi:hypothetical protein